MRGGNSQDEPKARAKPARPVHWVLRAVGTALGMAAMAAGAVGGAACPAAAQCEYTAVQLPSGPVCGVGPYIPRSAAINDKDEVCGYVTVFGCPDRPFFWDGKGPLAILPLPAGAQSARALDLNDHGLIVGYWIDSNTREQPCMWVDGSAIVLPLPAGANRGQAMAVNSSGVVVGWGGSTACMWVNGKLTTFHPGAPFTGSRAMDISDTMIVVGRAGGGPVSNTRAFVYQNGAFTILPPIPNGINSHALAVNNSGQVVGDGFTLPLTDPNTHRRSFLWRDGTMLDLGVLPGHFHTSMSAINDSGRIVGHCSANVSTTAVVWHLGVLSSLVIDGQGDSPLDPETINSAGLIAGDGAVLVPVSTPTGDIDQNCQVNVDDLIYVILSWGQTDSPADIDGSGLVDMWDLLIVLMNWG